MAIKTGEKTPVIAGKSLTTSQLAEIKSDKGLTGLLLQMGEGLQSKADKNGVVSADAFRDIVKTLPPAELIELEDMLRGDPRNPIALAPDLKAAEAMGSKGVGFFPVDTNGKPVTAGFYKVGADGQVIGIEKAGIPLYDPFTAMTLTDKAGFSSEIGNPEIGLGGGISIAGLDTSQEALKSASEQLDLAKVNPKFHNRLLSGNKAFATGFAVLFSTLVAASAVNSQEVEMKGGNMWLRNTPSKATAAVSLGGGVRRFYDPGSVKGETQIAETAEAKFKLLGIEARASGTVIDSTVEHLEVVGDFDVKGLAATAWASRSERLPTDKEARDIESEQYTIGGGVTIPLGNEARIGFGAEFTTTDQEKAKKFKHEEMDVRIKTGVKLPVIYDNRTRNSGVEITGALAGTLGEDYSSVDAAGQFTFGLKNYHVLRLTGAVKAEHETDGMGGSRTDFTGKIGADYDLTDNLSLGLRAETRKPDEGDRGSYWYGRQRHDIHLPKETRFMVMVGVKF